MTINGVELSLNEYGLEFDSFLGAIYLPWHTIIITALALIAYKIYKRIRNKKVVENYSLDNATNELWAN
jgi:hypothetical protein